MQYQLIRAYWAQPNLVKYQKMKNYSRANTIDLYYDKINSGEMDFSSLRKDLEDQNIEKEEIGIVIKQVDNQIIRSVQLQASSSLGKNVFYLGLTLSALGVLLTIGTYTGLIDLGNVYTIALGPIFGGLIIAFQGNSKMNRN